MRLVKEYDTGVHTCYLVELAGVFYFSRVDGAKLVDKRDFGQDEAEAIQDFDQEVQLIALEDGV